MVQKDKTKEEFIAEIKLLQKRITELEKLVSECKQTEELLRGSEERFRRFFEQSKDAIFVADLQTRKLLDCNLQAEKLIGRSKQEILSMRADDLHPKDVVDETMAMFKKQAAGENIIGESFVITKVGQRIPVSVNSASIEVGGKPSLVGIFRDITERKQVEEKIILAVEEWDRTFNSIGDLIFVQDKDMNIIKINKACAKVLKMDPKDILGRKCYDLLHNLDHPWPGCPFEKIRQDGVSHTEEIDDPHIGIPLLVTVSPIYGVNGELLGVVHIAKDITERQKLEKELRGRLQELEVFYKASVGREKRIIELKKEIEQLKKELGK